MKINKPDVLRALPQAIVFDTDNTLYHYDPVHEKALRLTFDKLAHRVGISCGIVSDAYSAARKDVKQQLGNTASAHSRLLYFQRTLEYLGLGSQILLALDLEQTYWRVFLDACEVFDGVYDVLDFARRNRIKLLIVTDLTAQIQFRKVIYFGFDSFFDYVVSSEEAGQDKPNASPFMLAKKKLGDQVKDIWMIGDNPLNDIFGAKTHLGAVTLQKVHQGVTEGVGEQRADASFKNYFDLLCFMKSVSDAA